MINTIPTHTKLTIYLPVSLKKTLKKQSELTGKSVSQLVVEKLESENKDNKLLKFFKMGDPKLGKEFSKQLDEIRAEGLIKVPNRTNF